MPISEEKWNEYIRGVRAYRQEHPEKSGDEIRKAVADQVGIEFIEQTDDPIKPRVRWFVARLKVPS
jgi:predicted secreted Zn-dependent protease